MQARLYVGIASSTSYIFNEQQTSLCAAAGDVDPDLWLHDSTDLSDLSQVISCESRCEKMRDNFLE